MSVTVLLPIYNGALTLAQAIDSILAQDHEDFELLLIDDASTDGSAGIAHDYAARDARVSFVAHDRNRGLAATLNEGLERARYELVARLDQDDEALPQRLHAQLDFMNENPRVAASGSWILHMGAQPRFDRLVELPASPKAIARRLPHENCLYHPAMIMRRSTVLDLGGYRAEFRNAEDYDLWLRLCREHDLANVPRPLLRYRFSLGGMTLGRKWEQLFYIRLAQATNRDPSITLEEATARANKELEETDRRWFMRQVASGTVAELVALRHWSDATRIATRFTREIGVVVSARLLASIARARARS